MTNFDIQKSTIFSAPNVFLDKQGHPVIIRPLEEESSAKLIEMYLAYMPRGSVGGLPPVGDEECVRWARQIIDTGISLIAVLFEKTVIGHVILFPMEEKICELLIIVSPPHQKNGIGTQLMRCGIQLAHEIGFHKIWLSVHKTNFVAIHLYNKCGFERVSFTDSPQVEMTLDLKRYHPTADVRVEAVMNRNVISINHDLTCREAVEIFLERHIEALPVVNENLEVVGILSQTDLIFKANMHRRIREVATREVVTIHVDSTIATAIRLFQSKKLRCIPVLDHEKKLVGVLGRRDILAHYFKNYSLFA